jgi:cytochrome c
MYFRQSDSSDLLRLKQRLWVKFLLCVWLAGCTRTSKPIASHTGTAVTLTGATEDTLAKPATFGWGRVATAQEIAAWDIDVRPDGMGLPAGSGNAWTGKAIYAAKCAACHGKTGIEGPYNRLVTVSNGKKLPAKEGATAEKTIGNYWPYATTVFDYIRRAMPFNEPGSLSDEEVYSLTAFLLQANQLIDSSAVMNAETLPKVVMPAQKLFVPDDRQGGPEVR